MAILEVTSIKKGSFHDKSATSNLFLVQAHEKALTHSLILRLVKKKKDNITLTKLYACCCFTFSYLKVSFIVGVSISE